MSYDPVLMQSLSQKLHLRRLHPWIITLQGQPLSWEALIQAAAKVAAVPPEPKPPALRVVSIYAASGEEENVNGAYALVDSGATHALRRANGPDEWSLATPVIVHLAGGEVVELRMNKAGTLLVPEGHHTRSTSSSPIVPLGALVGVLGYSMEWKGSKCRLVGREGDVLSLRVKDGCPETTESQALALISRIEDRKLEDLKAATAVTKGKIREAAISLNKTWFDHLIAYCKSGISSEALMAIKEAPFFEELPEASLYGLSEADPISNGWEALKGLRHLNRKNTKKAVVFEELGATLVFWKAAE